MPEPSTPVLLQRVLRASAAEVFDAWTDAARMRTWFWPTGDVAALAHVDPGTGDFTFGWPDRGLTLHGRRIEGVPGRRLVYDLTQRAPDGERRSRLQIDLQPTVAGTGVTLRHDGVAASERADVAAAWRRCFGRLIAGCPAAMDAYYAGLARAPGFHSPFGGLWPDRLDHAARLAAKCASGELEEADAMRFRHWLAQGYVELPQAVPHAHIDALLAEVDRDWRHGNAAVTVELCEGDGGYLPMHPSLRDQKTKVLEYHAVSREARDVQFAPAIRRFLEQLFERPAMAFQSLLFRHGTEQAMHQDTAYVVVRSPMQFVGCWIALEDVRPGSGELQYHASSHRIPEHLWFGRGRSRPPGFEDDREFLQWVVRESERAGCPVVRFLPKKGDALLWHADLVHGGSPRVHRDLTRQSLVSHFCPLDVEPEGAASGRHSQPVEHTAGAWYCHPLHSGASSARQRRRT